ncbi:PspC domain-containing protein [Leifsonia sp. NPDC058230]|uniref:PspC domain-containing protein n=1 Tax=Leifsonia sp. NPDC058230 TaxID=3346391 RepID=UPI0036D78810
MNILQRPLNGRILGGVCAGLARRFGWKPWTMRALFLISCLLPGPQVIAYIALWIIIPAEKEQPINVRVV